MKLFHAAVLLFLLGAAGALFAAPVTFEVCSQSATWTRPSPAVQAKIWNDGRYAGSPKTTTQAYEWTHDFIQVPADSASIQYHSSNVAGLWTATDVTGVCENRNNSDWVNIWVLLHRVTAIDREGSEYTIHVEPRQSGFQMIMFRNAAPAAKSVFRFVGPRRQADPIDRRRAALVVSIKASRAASRRHSDSPRL
jgi:hypothetical protein